MREENRSEIIHDALNMLDDEMIEEVEKIRGGVVTDEQKELRPWRKWVALAASVCVFVLVGTLWSGVLNKDLDDLAKEESGKNNQIEDLLVKDEADDLNNSVDMEEEHTDDMDLSGAVEEKKVALPAYKVNLKKENGLSSDMAALFIYQGRCYVQTCDYMTKDVVGDYVCTSTGLIDEWTTKDGYVELAGSVEDDFYEVKGIDPAFMLCAVYENGVVETFIHNNGITLSRGWELLTDRLGLDENYKQVSYLTREEWEKVYETKQKPTVLSEEHREVFDRFIAVFNEGDFIYAESLGMHRDVVYGSDAMYHLYITTEEGVPLHFLLLGDGYVSFNGLNQVCVQVDEEVYKAIIDIIENR